MLEPLLFVAVFYVVFNVILDSRRADFLVFLMCGKLAFIWFSKSINQASNSIVAGMGLIARINVPKTLFPMAVIQEGLYKQAAVFALLIAVLIANGYMPSATWLYLLPIVIVNYLMIVAREQKQWDALLRVIGRADLIGNPKFKDSVTRWQNVEEVNKIIEDWTSKQGAFDAFHTLCRAGVPAGVTMNSTQKMNDPHYLGREIILELDHPHRGLYKTFGCVQRLSGSDKIVYQTAPLLGQHNQEVLAKYLGYTHRDLDKLHAEGVI